MYHYELKYNEIKVELNQILYHQMLQAEQLKNKNNPATSYPYKVTQ